MRLVQTPRPVQGLKQKPTVSPQLVLANKLLQFSSLELEQAIARELAENPALEVREVQRCPVCGAEVTAGRCPTCGAAIRDRMVEANRDHGDAFDGGADTFAGNGAAGEWSDTISRLPSSTTLAEHLLRQARVSLAPSDVSIARHIIGSIDDRGFLSRDVSDIASDLDIEGECVEEVLAVVQSLEPVGIAARDARDCLLIQIADLRYDSVEQSVAERLIRDQWDRLGRSSLASLGQEVDASIDEVRGALRFIRENLNPFPAHAFWADGRRASSKGEVRCPQPDVIIRESDASGGYEIELPKAGSYGLRVSDSYRQVMDGGSKRHSLGDGNGSPETASPCDPQAWKRWEELCGRARLFVRSIKQRWETLHELMCCLVDYQCDFLMHGEQCLRPLTRAQVAEMMGVHESTVSRAVAGKHVELPCGKVVSLDTFFDSAAPIKHVIEELVDQEKGSLSDRAIAERLAERGYDVSRRTVAKYRNALNILPSSLRRRSKELGKRQETSCFGDLVG